MSASCPQFPPSGGALLSPDCCSRMETFRILYFRESVLEHTEEVRVRDMLEAIEKATVGKPPQIRAEVWSTRGRLAEIGVAPHGGDREPFRSLQQH